MRPGVLVLLAGCTFQVAGLPVAPEPELDPPAIHTPAPTVPEPNTPPASTPTPPVDVPDLSTLPDLSTMPDLAKPDLLPAPIECMQDCTVNVGPGKDQLIICDANQSCDVKCATGSSCTIQCGTKAECSCEGKGCKIDGCLVILCKGKQVCNQRCD